MVVSKMLCDRCGKEITPISSSFMLTENFHKLGSKRYDLCASCAMKFLHEFMHCEPEKDGDE